MPEGTKSILNLYDSKYLGSDFLFILSVFETKCLQVLYIKRNELVVITRLLVVAADFVW